jgi:hypothetical protein
VANVPKSKRKKHGMPDASACVRQIMFQYVNGFKRNSLSQLESPVDVTRLAAPSASW